MTDPTIHNAIFFISTGRCGTQWMADALSTHYSELAVVRHEPFQVGYQPRFWFGAYHRGDNITLSREIDDHLLSIADTIQTQHYIETGWPVYGVLPFILKRFTGRIKVVHLYRSPFMVAASLATHGVYSRGNWSEMVSISPSDYGIVQRGLEENSWRLLPEFEKCLFWWTEVNQFGCNRASARCWWCVRVASLRCCG